MADRGRMAGRLARAYLCVQSPFRGSELDNDALGSMAAEAGVSERPFVIPFLKCLVMLEKLGAFLCKARNHQSRRGL
jgi:hypothetical protein